MTNAGTLWEDLLFVWLFRGCFWSHLSTAYSLAISPLSPPLLLAYPSMRLFFQLANDLANSHVLELVA